MPTPRALPRPPGGAEGTVGGSVHAHLGDLTEVALGHRTGMDSETGASDDPTTVTHHRASGPGVLLAEASRVLGASWASRGSHTSRVTRIWRGHGGIVARRRLAL